MKTPTPPDQDRLFPDQKPIRVTVPVTPEVLEEFQRLAAASGVSVGKAMGEWLADTVDGVRSMRDLLEKAREAPKLAVAQLNAYALGLSDVTAQLLEDVRKAAPTPPPGATAGRAATGMRERPVGARPGGDKAAAAPFTPPSGNTGGKVPSKGAKGRKGAR